MNIVETLLGMTALGAEWVLWLLLALSVLSITVILERILYYSRIRVDFDSFFENLTNCLNADNQEAALKLCYKHGSKKSPAPLTAISGLEKFDSAFHVAEGSMASETANLRHKLDRGLVILGTLGNNAPFIGLFGTVIGIIQAFSDLALNPQGGPSVVMNGISEALVATAVGLIVAIPAVIAFNFFNKVVRKHMLNTEATTQLILIYAKARENTKNSEESKQKGRSIPQAS